MRVPFITSWTTSFIRSVGSVPRLTTLFYNLAVFDCLILQITVVLRSTLV